jgi:hypothetical protein
MLISTGDLLSHIRRRGRRLLLVAAGKVLALLALVSTAPAAPPQVVRVRIPSAQVAGWFPAGTELRMVDVEQFDALLETARKSQDRPSAEGPTRLIRARHHARWKSGTLEGHSELVVEVRATGPASLRLDPWTPFIPPAARGDAPAGADNDGKTTLNLPPLAQSDGPPRPSTLRLGWVLNARPQTQGRHFELGLPGDETTVLELELPDGWSPLGPLGYRQGPLAGATEGYFTWRYQGRPGLADLQIQKTSPRGPTDGPVTWVGGPTRIDLAVGDGQGKLGNWRTDWSVQLDSRGTSELTADLDPGLELIGVWGPAVKGFRTSREGASTRVVVAFSGSPLDATEVRYEALAHAPIEGRWLVPAIRPVDAVWTGGTTTILLDDSRKVRDCTERSGHRILAEAGSPAGGVRTGFPMVFEARSPESVAEIRFGRPRDDACMVRGRLSVGNSAPRLDCRITGLGGSSSELEIDLPPTWVPDRIDRGGPEDSLAWHATVGPDGGTRLRLVLPELEGTSGTRPLVIGATSTIAAGRGPLALPRVRPRNVPVRDEIWVATAEKTMVLKPVSARGVAWLDPAIAEDTPFTGRGPDQRPSLAWRWNSEDAEARIDRDLVDQDPRVQVRYVARISSDGSLLELDGRIAIEPGNRPLGGLPIWISHDATERGAWSFREEVDYQELPSRELDAAGRDRDDLPQAGTAWELTLDSKHLRATIIRFRFRGPWTSPGSIPVILAPRRFLPRGTVLIDVPHELRSQVRSSGMQRLDPATAERLAVAWNLDAGGETARSPRPPAHAFSYIGPGTLSLETVELARGRESGVVRDACLTTVRYPQGSGIDRLRLVVGSEQLRTLRFRMPPATSLVRVRLDGVDATPVTESGLVSIGLPAPGSSQRLRTIEIDYQEGGPVNTPDGFLRPVLPQIPMPCHSFCWELSLPPSSRAGDHGPGLWPNDAPPARNWPLGSLRIPSYSWPSRKPIRMSPSDEQLGRLDEATRSASSEESTFASWFTRWDSGTTPLIVDRLLVGDLGHGPRSRCVPAGQGPAKPPSALGFLRQYGLAMVPVEAALVITSQAEAERPDAQRSWRGSVVEALLWGSDRSDRFQTVARWRGEVTPRESSTGGLAEGTHVLPGWSTCRYSAASWPEESAHVRLVADHPRTVAGWIVALAVAAGLGNWRRGSILAPISLLCLSVLLHLWLPAGFDGLTAGLFVGALPVALLRLGGLVDWKKRTDRSALRIPGPLSSRPARSILRPLPILLLVLIPAQNRAGATRQEEGMIPVLLPYDGKFDPEQPPTRAVLRLTDFKRIGDLAGLEASRSLPQVTLDSAAHHVAWSSDRDAVVESELTIRNPGTSVAIWNVPVGGGREISSTIEGRPVPIFIDGTGEQAAIQVPASSSVTVRVRRTIGMTREGPVHTVSFPVNPMPSARLVVDRPLLPLSSLEARGAVSTREDSSVAADLGPAARVEVRLRDPRSAEATPESGGLESLTLWDIEPAGDDLRTRFTYRGTRRLSELTFRLEPGLIPRKIAIPGLIEQSWGGNAARPTWTVHMDPPLVEGAQFMIEAWRPLVVGGGRVSDEGTGHPTAESSRTCPLLEPVGLDRHNGLLGVRRPGHWTGRLEGEGEPNPLGDESFVKAWGPLPDERLTLAGTTRLDYGKLPTLQTGPGSARLKTRPTTQVRIGPGRIDLLFEAELGETPGLLDRLRVQLPRDMTVLEVASEGLTNWSAGEDRVLLLRYDRLLPPRRSLRITGWIPVAEDPLNLGNRQRRVPTPWVKVDGADSSPGQIIVTAVGRVDVEDGPGMTLQASSPPSPTATGDGPSRQSFRVDDPSRLGELHWTSPAPRLSVQIESQLTVHPEAAEWVAILRYEVAGGAIDAIHLKVPTAWAARAEVELGDEELHRKSEARGASTIWNISSDRPIWGTRRLVVRSVMPGTPGQEIQHPEITPLGHGLADLSLGVVNATGADLTRSGSSGLRPIAYASRFEDEEFVQLPGADSWAFHVDREGWSLRVQLPPSSESPDESVEQSARVVSADVSITVMPDGRRTGLGVYEVQPRSGPFLVAELPPGGTLLSATVENAPIEPLLAADGRWLVPLGEQVRKRVGLFWSEASRPASSSDAPWSLTLPRAGAGRVSTLVTLRLPEGIEIRPAIGGLDLTAADRVELERADRIARQIAESLGQIDRSSGSDRQRIVPLLIAHELALRSADRSLRWSARAGENVRKERADRDLELIRSARKALAETLRASGMDDEIARAQAAVGESTRPPAMAASIGLADPATPARVRSLGRPTFLIGLSAGLDEEATVIVGAVERTSQETDIPERSRSILMLGFLAALLVAALPHPRPGRRAAVMLVGILGLVGFVAGPIVLAACAGLSGLGWFARSGSREDGGSPRSRVGLAR